METLFAKHDKYLLRTPMKIIRSMMQRINWDSRLISIKGPKGVGKSTLMKQHIKLNYKDGSREALYCSMDSMYFSTHSLLDLADTFVKYGGKRLYVDEVHKYPFWSREIKEIYDLYPELKVVISGSSLLKIQSGDSDLSRRCVPYEMPGLSFREFLKFDSGIDIPVSTLESILNDSWRVCDEVCRMCRPLEKFTEYLKHGYYPFYYENPADYATLVENVANYIIDSELTQERNVDVANTRKIKALLYVLANNLPFQVSIASLSKSIGLERNTVLAYLKYLDEAKLIKLLYSDILSVKKMQKPDKIFLDNSNLQYVLSSDIKIGTVRETFAINQLSTMHIVEYGKDSCDFKIDGKFTIEVGGEGKTFSQITGIQDSYVAADGIEYPIGAKIPLWSLGLMY